jgi:transcriptional regulator with XRE-family HTH domain
MHDCIMNATEQWFTEVVGDRSEREVARRVGIIQATLSRQLRADTLSPEHTVAIARAYGASAVAGLVSIGLITDREVKEAAGLAGIRDITDEALADEIVRRIQENDSHPSLTEPIVEIHQGGGDVITA